MTIETMEIPDGVRCEKINALGVRCSRANDHEGFTDHLFEMPSDEEIRARIAEARREAFVEAATMALDARPPGMRDAVLEGLAEQIMARAGVNVSGRSPQ